MGECDFTSAISRVNEILSTVGSSKSQDVIVSKALLSALSTVQTALGSAEESQLLGNANLSILEELCSCKHLVLGKSLQSMVVSIYDGILRKAPGYAVRNVVNSMISIFNNKLLSNNSKECSIAVIGALMEFRSFDCGSMITDVIQCLSKAAKLNEVSMRLAAFNAFSLLVNGAGQLITDCHLEIAKLAAKYCTDRSSEVRQSVALLFCSLAQQTAKGSITPETFVSFITKGLEDENIFVQDLFSKSYSLVFVEQMKVYLELQEKSKIGAARGGSNTDSNDKKKPVSRLSMPKLSITAQKKLVEEYDVRSIIAHFLRCILKSAGVLRSSYILATSYFVRECLESLESTDFEWIVTSLLGLLHDPVIVSLPFEDSTYFRNRMSLLFSKSITSRLPEPKLLQFSTILMQFIASMDVRSDLELQLALCELGHAVTILGEAASAVSDEVQAVVATQLRHSCFGVRSASAYVLVSIAQVVPGVAADILRTSLTNAQTQATQLSNYEGFEGAAGQESEPQSNSSSDTHDDPSFAESSKRKSPKEVERFQRMYFFHGHTFVVSLFVKNEHKLPCGLPSQLIYEVFDFGVELLQHNITSAPPLLRNIACSLVRAGSLIASSIISLGYFSVKSRLVKLLVCCDTILKHATAPAETAQVSSKSGADDMLYELMSVEAALVCVSTLLWSCPDSLEHEAGCLDLVIECLEMGFRSVKFKYQPKFRAHFRFRTLHTILLECFAWLPPGSFPTSSQQLFVEALRVFRDNVSTNECNFLCGSLGCDYISLNLSIGRGSVASSTLSGLGVTTAKPPFVFSSCLDIPESEDMFMLRLEAYAVALPKKESEAFLAIFGTDSQVAAGHRSNYLPGIVWRTPRSPCQLIEARTVDAAISLLGATFGHQSIEFQEKGVQLCAQAMAQVSKTGNSLGMFSSDEEKRRREKKAFVTSKNVAACLSSIIESFPFEIFSSPSFHLSWSQTVVDLLLEMVNHPVIEIRAASSRSLALLSGQMTRSSLLDSVYSQLSSNLMLACDKKGENLADYCGTMLAFSNLWINASLRPTLQKTILTNYLEFLRKTDLSGVCRAHGLFAIGDIVPKIIFTDLDTQEMAPLFEKICHVIEVNAVSVSNSAEEWELFFCCLQRLTTATIVAILKYIEKVGLQVSDVLGTPKDEKSILSSDLNGILSRLLRIWEVVQLSCKHAAVIQESIKLLSQGCLFDSFLEKVSPERCYNLLRSVCCGFTQLSIATLQLAVNCISEITKKSTKFVSMMALDVCLLELLDWCYRNTKPSQAMTLASLDVRSVGSVGLHLLDGNISCLQSEVESVLIQIAEIVATMPNGFATHGVLYFRAVALGLRSNSSVEDLSKPNVGLSQEDDEENPGQSSSELASPVLSPLNPQMNLQQYLVWCRAISTSRAQSNMTALSVRLKCVAVKAASVVLNGSSSSDVLKHHDILLARNETSAALGSRSSTENLDSIPCYLSLFLQDIVNFACASATYTVNDKRIISLQLVSLNLLEAIISLFGKTVDPDVILDEKSNSDKILSQSISQVLSAVRPAIACLFSPELSLCAGRLVCELLRFGFLDDKVAVKRVVKLLLSFQEKDYSLQSRAPPSSVLSDEFAVKNHLVIAGITARLYLETTESVLAGNVSGPVKTAIKSMLQEHLAPLTELWSSSSVDASRVLLTKSKCLLPNEESDDSEIKNNLSVPVVSTPLIWPSVNPQVDCRRGGITFPSTCKTDELVHFFQAVFPEVLAASTFSPSFQSDRLAMHFAICQSAFPYLTSKLNSSSHQLFTVVCVLSTLCNLSSGELDMEAVLPLDNWSNILSCYIPTVANKLVPSKTSSRYHDVILVTVDLLSHLTTRLMSKPLPSIRTSALWSWLWRTSLTLITSIFPAITPIADRDYFVSSGNSPRILRIPLISEASKNVSFADQMKYLTQTFETNQTDSNSNMLSKLISCISNLAKMRQSDVVYAIQILTSLIPYLSAVPQCFSESVRTFLLSQLMDLAGLHQNANAEIISGLVCSDLIEWSKYLSALTSSEASMLELPFQHLLEGILDSLRALTSQQDVNTPFLIGDCLITMIEKPSLLKSFLVHLVRTIPTNIKFGKSLLESLFPSILYLLSGEAIQDESTAVLLVQLCFVSFNFTEADKKESFLTVLLSVLCYVLTARSWSSVVLLCGQGFTHLARSNADCFRNSILLLNAEQRATLQNAMKIALENSAAPDSTTSSSVSSTNAKPTISAKKIDLMKYKK